MSEELSTPNRHEGGVVAIVDYDMGNLYSVARACAHVGLASSITDDPAVVLAADAVIVPGVGAMPEAMRRLNETGLSDALRTVAARGTPVFGICLGLQLLMSDGTEFGAHEGLGLIGGRVVRFPSADLDGKPLRVPHIGWSPVHRPGLGSGRGWDESILSALPDGAFQYFVHSYYVEPNDPGLVAAESEYGGRRFCSAVTQGNVFACQFHPERSGPVGLAMYEAFARLVRGGVARA